MAAANEARWDSGGDGSVAAPATTSVNSVLSHPLTKEPLQRPPSHVQPRARGEANRAVDALSSGTCRWRAGGRSGLRWLSMKREKKKTKYFLMWFITLFEKVLSRQ